MKKQNRRDNPIDRSEHFINLCEGNQFDGKVLSTLYDLAFYYAPLTREFPVEFLELRSKVKGSWKNSAIDLIHTLTSLSRKIGILTFKVDEEITLEDDDGVYCPGAAFCVVDTQLIDTRIRQLPEEVSRVNAHNKRALTLDLPATLTIASWVSNLNRFHWQCAYCCEGNYEVLEHIIPLTYSDSGTTSTNCVPACKKCNGLKGPYHPEKMPNPTTDKIGATVERVQQFIEGCYKQSEPRASVRRLQNWTQARLSGKLDAPPVIYPDVQQPTKPVSITESMGIKKDLAAMLERVRRG